MSHETHDPSPATAAHGVSPDPASGAVRRRLLMLAYPVLILAIAASFWGRMAVYFEYYQARDLLSQRRNRAAISVLRRALGHDPRQVTILQLLARAHRRLNHKGVAELLLDRAEALGGDRDWIERERRLVLAQAGHLRAVEPFLADMLIHAGADGPDICEAFVQGYFSNLRSGPAFRLLDTWQQSYPDDPQPLFMRAYFWQSMNQPGKAITLYRKGLAMAPGRTTMRRRLAESLIDADKWDETESELAICLRQTPRDPEVHYLLARCAYARSDLDEAITRLAETIKIAPDHIGAHRLKGQLDLAEGRVQESIRELERVLAQHPHDTWAHEAMGRALRAARRDDEADQHFQYVAEAEKSIGRMDRLVRQSIAKPDDPELRFEIGQILFQYGAPEDAVRWMRATLELNPNHVGAHRALAAYFERIGDSAGAARHRQLASQASPKP